MINPLEDLGVPNLAKTKTAITHPLLRETEDMETASDKDYQLLDLDRGANLHGQTDCMENSGYIEAFYNRNRIHTSLDGFSPANFELKNN